MWIRTTMNYQYRYGTTTTQAFKKLWAEGGFTRLYRGVGPAFIQGPLSRYVLYNVYTGLVVLPVSCVSVNPKVLRRFSFLASCPTHAMQSV